MNLNNYHDSRFALFFIPCKNIEIYSGLSQKFHNYLINDYNVKVGENSNNKEFYFYFIILRIRTFKL